MMLYVLIPVAYVAVAAAILVGVPYFWPKKASDVGSVALLWPLWVFAAPFVAVVYTIVVVSERLPDISSWAAAAGERRRNRPPRAVAREA